MTAPAPRSGKRKLSFSAMLRRLAVGDAIISPHNRESAFPLVSRIKREAPGRAFECRTIDGRVTVRRVS